MPDYHQILGVKPDASKEEIKDAYRRLSKKYHPDVNDSENAHEQFLLLKEAYEHLSHDHVKDPWAEVEDLYQQIKEEEIQRRNKAREYADQLRKEKQERLVNAIYSITKPFKFVAYFILVSNLIFLGDKYLPAQQIHEKVVEHMDIEEAKNAYEQNFIIKFETVTLKVSKAELKEISNYQLIDGDIRVSAISGIPKSAIVRNFNDELWSVEQSFSVIEGFSALIFAQLLLAGLFLFKKFNPYELLNLTIIITMVSIIQLSIYLIT